MKVKDAVKNWPKMKLHKHDTIPSYTSDVKGGCVICIENKAMEELGSLELDSEKVWKLEKLDVKLLAQFFKKYWMLRAMNNPLEWSEFIQAICSKFGTPAKPVIDKEGLIK